MYLLLKQWVKIIHFQTTKANCANPRAVMFRERWGSAMDVCPLQVLTRLMWHKRDLEPPRQVGPHCSSCRAQKRWECMHAEACLVTGGQVSEVAFLLVCVFQDALSTMLIVTSRICIGMYLSHSVWRQWIRCPCGYEGATMDLRLCAIEGFCWCGVLQISWLHLLNSALHSWLHWNVSLSPAAPYFIATVLRSWKHLELPLRFEDTLYSLVPTLAASTSSG